jgi:hypothetical protein
MLFLDYTLNWNEDKKDEFLFNIFNIGWIIDNLVRKIAPLRNYGRWKDIHSKEWWGTFGPFLGRPILPIHAIFARLLYAPKYPLLNIAVAVVPPSFPCTFAAFSLPNDKSFISSLLPLKIGRSGWMVKIYNQRNMEWIMDLW